MREALINAIVHRNYHIKAPIKVSFYDNRVEIFSPGDFPGQLHANNLLMGLTYIRNGAIAKVFRESGYSEKLGTGFRIIFSTYKARGLPEPKIIEGENFVKCILPRKELKPSISRDEDSVMVSILDLFVTAQSLSSREIIELVKLP